MKTSRFVALILVVAWLSGVHTRAEFPFETEIAPLLSFNSGTADWSIGGENPVVLSNGDTTALGWKSRLIYPLDFSLVGAEIMLRPGAESNHGWSLGFTFLTNIVDPGGLMEDHDWYTFPEYRVSRKFQFTESRTKINYKHFAFELGKQLHHGAKVNFLAIAGYEFTRFHADMIGATGWAWDADNTISLTRKVLTYDADYHRPYLGVKMEIAPSWQWLLSTKMALMRIMISDHDDHVLRFKTAEATTSGTGFLLAAGGRILFSEHGRWRPFGKITGQLTVQKASGEQRQEWYRDETYWNPNEGLWVTVADKGLVIEGIDYETKSTQVRYGLAFGVAF